MIGALVATLTGSALARTVLRYGVTALAILLFLQIFLNQRGGKIEHLVEQAGYRSPATDLRPKGCVRHRSGCSFHGHN
jgi:hypothetical protein